MNGIRLLTDNRYCAEHFNRDEYPMLFERVKKQIEDYLAERKVSDFKADIEEILSEVHANSSKHFFKFRRESTRVDDHIVLSLFVAPAAKSIGSPDAIEFANALARAWEERYPDSVFKVGDYDDIMEGFKWKLTITSK